MGFVDVFCFPEPKDVEDREGEVAALAEAAALAEKDDHMKTASKFAEAKRIHMLHACCTKHATVYKELVECMRLIEG